MFDWKLLKMPYYSLECWAGNYSKYPTGLWNVRLETTENSLLLAGVFDWKLSKILHCPLKW
jgi:hypothetical protein